MSRRKVVWMFSGQGSQYHGMGRELYEREPVFRETMERCDAIVQPWLGRSLVDAIYAGGRGEEFDATRLTHPAICAVQLALAATLRARGHEPDLLLGYSLGEFVAQVVGGAVTLETALELLDRHARLMETATPPGGMLAVLARPEALREQMEGIADVWLAARNFENHCVASGAARAIAELQRRLDAREIVAQRLPVRCAFHSPLMDPAEPEFRRALATIPRGVSQWAVISARTGEVSTGLDELWTATRESVNFLGAVRRLEAQHEGGLAYVDLGAAGTLATFLKYIGVQTASRIVPTMTPWGTATNAIAAYASSV